MSSFSLLSSRRFGAVFACITLSAFNDNYYKNSLVILLTFELAARMGVDTAVLINIASAFFILPFFLCSGLAGEMADAMPKHRLVRILKVTEAVLMVAAAAALLLDQTWPLLAILFLVGMQAAFFGPTKYAILPQLLSREELLMGNGLVEGGTFLSILMGTLIGGLLILHPHGKEIVAVSLAVMGMLGLFFAWRVPETAISNSGMRIDYNIFKSTWRMVRHAFENPKIGIPILGVSWFWAIGAIYLIQLPVFTKDVLGGNENVVTLFNGVFTIGIALGSFICPAIVQRLHARDLSPLALTGVFLFGLDLCWVGYHVDAPTADALVGLMAYLQSSTDHVRIAIDLFLMAFCGGIFIVPLYTQLQTQSLPEERARTIASNNVVNALFIAAAFLLSSVMFAQKFSVLQVLLIFVVLNIPMIFLLRRIAGPKPESTGASDGN